MRSLSEWRAEFPILADCCYLLNHSVGAMPKGAGAALQAFADEWSSRGGRAWSEGWWDLPVRIGDEIGQLLNAPAGSVVVLPNVTTAVHAVLSALSWNGPRHGIVSDAAEFPSVLYLLHSAGRSGARVTMVPSDGLSVDTEAMTDAIDERTGLVVVSHALYKNSALVDVAALAERARSCGARLLVDAHQSVGIVPVDVARLDVDFLVGGAVKWLCGGPGAGFLYVKPEVAATLEPAFAGWGAHAEPFALDSGPIRYREGAARFLNGSPHVPSFYSVRPGLSIIAGVGLPAIRERSLALTRRIMDRADEAGLSVRTPREDHRRGGTVALAVPNAPEVTRRLLEREFVVDCRPGAGIRISPHFFTDLDEVDAVVREIGNITAGAAETVR